MKKKPLLVPVTSRALFQRISRTLAKKGERLIANRRVGPVPDIGNYYTVDVKKNSVARTHVDLEEIGRELGALKPWERLKNEKPAGHAGRRSPR
jgi:hypothetical protein